MEYLFAIFGLGFGITLVVAKGILQAHEFANEELEKQKPLIPVSETDDGVAASATSAPSISSRRKSLEQ